MINSKGILPECQCYRNDCFNTSVLISCDPCYVSGIIVAPTDTAAVVKVYLRNGEIVTSPILIPIHALYGEMSHCFLCPIYFDRGLFLEFNSNVDYVFLQHCIK